MVRLMFDLNVVYGDVSRTILQSATIVLILLVYIRVGHVLYMLKNR